MAFSTLRTAAFSVVSRAARPGSDRRAVSRSFSRLRSYSRSVAGEMAKVVLPLMLLEKRPWLYRGVSSIFTACIVSALVFASIENLLYITVYIPEKDLTGALIKYRLVVCTTLHVACTAISAYGLAAAWRRAKDRCSEFDMAAATPYLATAMAIHGVYNAIAALLTVG